MSNQLSQKPTEDTEVTRIINRLLGTYWSCVETLKLYPLT